MSEAVPYRQIRALYGARTLRIYQAYGRQIAESALAHGRFVSPPFSMTRMTWIKPSFLWMMYRCGWGRKDRNQERVLAIDITRDGFAWALAHSCPSHPGPSMSRQDWEALKARSPVRVQWDPERDLHLAPLPHRSIQVGLSGRAAELYVHEWLVGITEVTALAHSIHERVAAGQLEEARRLLPQEAPYPLEVP
jgi:hypothetical protein